ncbi:DUF1285 domain-containing protein [Aliikangiella sp. G2MR2-5]|uniref:DUF1285 domain-containing protein n=1 Tax=Aliikangiella sp. G2MR2-5 TaxID=2788943 RepID=UPI0018ABF87F|nr:DUF1285 domain-containing protein [Aliikangiella sp. G2MR2-5]
MKSASNSPPESLIKAIGDSPMPPVEKWNPDYCGEMGLTIKADGQWIYQGTPFTHAKMKQLFSRVIKREGEKYYLVTPVEKLGIEVEWQPFTIVDFDWCEGHKGLQLECLDNCKNKIQIASPERLILSSFLGQQLPAVLVRRNLYAGFNRSCYYRLLEQASIRQDDDTHQVYIRSNGIDFNLGTCQQD